MALAFQEKGWAQLSSDAALAAWAETARQAGIAAAESPELAHWWQCEGTWFVGVDALPNDPDGVLNGLGLGQRLRSRVEALVGPMGALHPAQVSIIRPGYPKPREGESATGFGYRQKRDAAHVDGLRLDRKSGVRCCAEYHAYVLGIPLNNADEKASPMVLWEGSHIIMQRALKAALAPYPQEVWSTVDISAPYKEARKKVFETCLRRQMTARPGEAYVLHRHLLHGVAPWDEGASASAEGRMVAYFRPETQDGIVSWLHGDPHLSDAR